MLSGLVDDIRDLSAKSRLAAQVAIGTVGSVLLLSGLGWSPMTTLVVSGVVVVWLISFVNAFNFMDGINGISVAQSAVAGLAWFVLGWVVGEPFLALSGLAQAGAALGFAPVQRWSGEDISGRRRILLSRRMDGCPSCHRYPGRTSA